jgi:alpha-acetolactate decarboxylase
MKKIIILLTFFVASTTSYAQSFFDSLEDMDGVSVVVVNKDLFDLLSKFESEQVKNNQTMKVFSMVQELKELKIFTTDDAVIANKMDKMVSKAIKKQNLTELMRVKDDDSRIKIYVKASKNKDYVSEVLMFIRGIDKRTKENVDSVIVSLTGNIDINKMSEITDTFVKEVNK